MSHRDEVGRGERFKFGANWSAFLSILTDKRIADAQQSLASLLGVSDLSGKAFLDAGSGSGLSSLVARRLGARVHSFDYDPKSVTCTAELRHRHFPDDAGWTVESGSVLDDKYIRRLGTFDVVYSWGVLHHTGAMWVGIESVISCVAERGTLVIAIYNDQGWKSHFWWFVKALYNKLPPPISVVYGFALGTAAEIVNVVKYTIRLEPMKAIRPLIDYEKRRGMSLTHDMLDWVGGFPYEFAKYDVLVTYMRARGFALVAGIRATSAGCHEMVFVREGDGRPVQGREAAGAWESASGCSSMSAQ